MKIAMRHVAPGMTIIRQNEFAEDDEPTEYRMEVVSVAPPRQICAQGANGDFITTAEDAEVEVEIPGFVKIRTDICGCEWIVVDMSSPIGIDATDDEHGYLKTKNCSDEGHGI